MESLGAIFENEWSSFSSAMCSNEESQFMAHLFNDSSVSGDFHVGSGFVWPDHDFKISDTVDIDSIDASMSSNCGNYCTASDWNQMLVANNDSMSSDCCMKEASDDVLENNDFLIREMIMNLPEPCKEIELKHPVQKSKKRCYNTGDNVQKNKRTVKPRKNQKIDSSSKINDTDMKREVSGQSLSSYSSDDDDEPNAVIGGLSVASTNSGSIGAAPLDTNGKKTRTKGGIANDPQSIYARKRRERINERLRTLQNLVPNGTKVDISTMLEEAVQYVKFLQLQIKLLSSNDLWMYAPIAYNGMDLGLDLNVTMPR
ncbi:Transcription factor bHLH84 [Heracleum sosnowskyi]|uniref:Transcription factor bHLH84 n=1 Tax=Heracleum sosnowskyi TaxID=360622 RepID=A0AAD8H3T1_9APIA|nr:Transcription factor bHLH84 [Heracleum sosnowskyi]